MAARVSQPELAAPPLAARPRMARGEEERVARAARDRGGGAAVHLGDEPRRGLGSGSGSGSGLGLGLGLGLG